MADGVSTDDSQPVAVSLAAEHTPPRRASVAAPPTTVSARLHGLRAWWALAQPATWVLSAAPAVIALTLVWARGTPLMSALACLAVVAILLVHTGGTMLNDYLEYVRSTAHDSALWAPETADSSILALTAIYPLNALRASVALLVLAAVAGIPLIMAGGMGVALLGILGIGGAIAYSSTRYALKRWPLGDVAVPLACGPGVLAFVMLSQHATPSARDLWLSAALGLFALALVEATHLRDARMDAEHGRKTLVVLLGERAGRGIFAAGLAGAYLVVLVLALPAWQPHGIALTVFSLPYAVLPLTGGLVAQVGAPRRRIVAQTLTAYLLFAVLLVIGLLADGMLPQLG